MLLETELSGDRDRPGAPMATAVCSFGGTRGKGPREPIGLQPGQDDPQGEKWLGWQSQAEGQGERGSRDTAEKGRESGETTGGGGGHP